MDLSLQSLRQGQGEETPEFSALLIADGRLVASVTSEGRGGAPRVHWMDSREDEGVLPVDRKAITDEVVKRTLKYLKNERPFVDVLRRSPNEAFMFLPEFLPVTNKRLSVDLDHLAEGIFLGYAPDGAPWSGGTPNFNISFSGIKAARHTTSESGGQTRISAVIESGSDGVYADSHLFWRFLKAYPTGETALLKAFDRSFKPEIPNLKAKIVKHFTDPDFSGHLTGAVFGWRVDDDWEEPTDISVGTTHFYNPRVTHSSIHVPWVVDVSFTTKKKAPAGAPFTGMGDKELNKWIGIWEGLGPENFWMDGELRATRPQAYKMYRSRWRAMTPREQTRMYDDLKPYEGRRLASIKRVADAFMKKASPNDLARAVASYLKSKSTKSGGRFVRVDIENGYVGAEPNNRQRLDHYGNDGDGWDEEAWESEYAGPLREEVEVLLNRNFPGNDFSVGIDEKGFVEIEGRSLREGTTGTPPMPEDDLPESWKRAAQEPLPLVERVAAFLEKGLKIQRFSKYRGFEGRSIPTEKVDVESFRGGSYIDVYLDLKSLEVPSLPPWNHVFPRYPGPEDETFDYYREEEWESEFLEPFNKLIVDQLDKAFPEARGHFKVVSSSDDPFWIINIEHPDF